VFEKREAESSAVLVRGRVERKKNERKKCGLAYIFLSYLITELPKCPSEGQNGKKNSHVLSYIYK
jgi:hypothetical protein